MTQNVVRPDEERGGGEIKNKVRKTGQRAGDTEPANNNKIKSNSVYAPTLHPCISETPNANLSFPPQSDFLVVTIFQKRWKPGSNDYQHTMIKPLLRCEKQNGGRCIQQVRARCWRGDRKGIFFIHTHTSAVKFWWGCTTRIFGAPRSDEDAGSGKKEEY